MADELCRICRGELPPATIFVFGSNLAGLHGLGAALHASVKHGAISGIGVGIQGDSYAIPTKPTAWEKWRDLHRVSLYVAQFLDYARLVDVQFYVTRIGCGSAGFWDDQIAPMFAGAPGNVILPEGWR